MTVTPRRRYRDIDTGAELASALGRHDERVRKDAEEYAAKYDTAKRLQALKDGDALPGNPPKFPIKDQADMDHAANLKASSSVPTATVEAHMRKQAKKHGLTLPKSMQGRSTS